MTPLRHRPTLLCTLGAVALTVLAAACAEVPSAPRAARATLAPSAAPSLEVVSPEVVATGLTRTTWADTAVVTTFEATSAGGTVKIPGGLRIDVPGGVFKDPQTITVTTLPGQMVAYEFQPHGLKFKKPLAMQQDLKDTDTKGKDLSRLEIGYFADLSGITPSENKALIKEFLKANHSVAGNHVAFDVFHFSGYMVSTGRGHSDF